MLYFEQIMDYWYIRDEIYNKMSIGSESLYPGNFCWSFGATGLNFLVDLLQMNMAAHQTVVFK